VSEKNAGQRNSKGQFVAGNLVAKGHRNPNASKAQRLHQAMLAAVSPGDIKKIIRKLVKMAKGGDIGAATQILDRTLGRPKPAEIEQPSDAPKRVRWSVSPPEKQRDKE